jgi:hypothetical protein
MRQSLESHFTDPLVTVATNLMVFFVPGERRRHVTPDLMLVRGAARRERPNYLVWEEGKGPDFVLEVTTLASRTEDTEEKFQLYRDVLLVPEYFLFDPQGDALAPRLQGYRLHNAGYLPVEPEEGFLPSTVLGLHLKAEGEHLRFFDPSAGRWLPTPAELAAQDEAIREQAVMEQHWGEIAGQQARARQTLDWARQVQAEASQAHAEAARLQAEAARAQEQAARIQAEAVRALELATRRQAEAAKVQEEAVSQLAEVERLREQMARQSAEAEVQVLRRELEFLSRFVPGE